MCSRLQLKHARETVSLYSISSQGISAAFLKPKNEKWGAKFVKIIVCRGEGSLISPGILIKFLNYVRISLIFEAAWQFILLKQGIIHHYVG